MNRYLYVVEGKTDIAKLKSLGAKYVIQTQGYNIHKRVINFLKIAQVKRNIVLLFDPDGPGKMIYKMIASTLTDFDTVNVRKQMSIKKGKVGIAETESVYLTRVLENYLDIDKRSNEKDSISVPDLMELGLIGDKAKEKREVLQERFYVNISNSKTLLNDLNILKLTKNEVRKIISGK